MADNESTPDPEDIEELDTPTGDEVADKRVRGALKRMHEATQEAARLKGQLEVLQSQRNPPPEEEKVTTIDDLLTEEDLEKLRDDPAHVKVLLKRVDSSLRTEFAAALRAVHQDLSSRVGTIDPERVQLKPIMDDLRKEPEFREWADEQLLAMARVRARQEGGRRGVSASTGGRAAIEERAKPTENDAIQKDPILKSAYQAMFGHVLAEKNGGKK